MRNFKIFHMNTETLKNLGLKIHHLDDIGDIITDGKKFVRLPRAP